MMGGIKGGSACYADARMLTTFARTCLSGLKDTTKQKENRWKRF